MSNTLIVFSKKDLFYISDVQWPVMYSFYIYSQDMKCKNATEINNHVLKYISSAVYAKTSYRGGWIGFRIDGFGLKKSNCRIVR